MSRLTSGDGRQDRSNHDYGQALPPRPPESRRPDGVKRIGPFQLSIDLLQRAIVADKAAHHTNSRDSVVLAAVSLAKAQTALLEALLPGNHPAQGRAVLEQKLRYVRGRMTRYINSVPLASEQVATDGSTRPAALSASSTRRCQPPPPALPPSRNQINGGQGELAPTAEEQPPPPEALRHAALRPRRQSDETDLAPAPPQALRPRPPAGRVRAGAGFLPSSELPQPSTQGTATLRERMKELMEQWRLAEQWSGAQRRGPCLVERMRANA